MKQYLKLKLDQNNYFYREEFSEGIYLEILGHLLLGEVKFRPAEFIDWVENPYYKGFSGNLVFCRKRDDGTIVIYFDTFVMDDVEERLIVSKKTFIKIMEDWGRFLREKPEEILVTKEGDEITLEGKN